MKPAAFDYCRPGTLQEALECLARHDPDAKILAGGQSLVPLMNFRLASPAVLVDVNGIEDLAYIREHEGHLAIGALTRHAEIESSPLVAGKCPLLAEATRLIGHRTIRNRATLGGSLAHADPSAEYPTVLTALDGEVVACGPGGERTIPAGELFVTVCTSSLAPNEILTEVRVPMLPPGTGWAFAELSRRHGDYAMVGVATTLALDAEGRCRDIRIALAGVGDTPLRCPDAESFLEGRPVDEASVDEAAARCAAPAEPEDDLHASAAYKKAMVEVYVRRALVRARARCGGGDDA
ncbi:MAG: FAD binding domain-containing protein [Planctomycetota bacterium]|jgi:CO/xanthine dehydrogenase FAD-binding subunit